MGLWCATKCGFCIATGDNQLSGWRNSKALPKAKLSPKKGHGHCLIVYCPPDPLELSESQWNCYIWEICSVNWWDAQKTAMPAAGIGQQKGPDSSQQCLTARCTSNASNVEQIGLWRFASPSIFTWTLTNWLWLLQAPRQLFAGKMLPQPAGGRKCFPIVHQILRHGFLCYRNKHISDWQKYVDCNGSYFDW